jgi:hypothetical protein
MEPKGFMRDLKRGSACELIVMGMTNTPLIAPTKIIEPMMFVDYHKQDNVFLLGFGMAMQYPSMSQ